VSRLVVCSSNAEEAGHRKTESGQGDVVELERTVIKPRCLVANQLGLGCSKEEPQEADLQNLEA